MTRDSVTVKVNFKVDVNKANISKVYVNKINVKVNVNRSTSKSMSTRLATRSTIFTLVIASTKELTLTLLMFSLLIMSVSKWKFDVAK